MCGIENSTSWENARFIWCTHIHWTIIPNLLILANNILIEKLSLKKKQAIKCALKMYQIINQSSYPKALYDTFLSHKATVQKLTYGQCVICFCQVGLSFFPKYTSYKYFWNKLAHLREKMSYSTAKKFLCLPKFKRHHYFWYSQQPQIEVIQVSIKGWANKTWHINKMLTIFQKEQLKHSL